MRWRDLARALAPGGYLLLTFPSVPQRRHLRLVAWRERRIGFKPEDIDTCGRATRPR